jgi:hypothetical protein
MWNNPELEGLFDIIIEDGLHTYEANVCFFENSIHKLNYDGYYIIEDILKTDVQRFHSKIKEWKITYPDLLFTLVEVPSITNHSDNILLVIKKLSK